MFWGLGVEIWGLLVGLVLGRVWWGFDRASFLVNIGKVCLLSLLLLYYIFLWCFRYLLILRTNIFLTANPIPSLLFFSSLHLFRWYMIPFSPYFASDGFLLYFFLFYYILCGGWSLNRTSLPNYIRICIRFIR